LGFLIPKIDMPRERATFYLEASWLTRRASERTGGASRHQLWTRGITPLTSTARLDSSAATLSARGGTRDARRATSRPASDTLRPPATTPLALSTTLCTS